MADTQFTATVAATPPLTAAAGEAAAARCLGPTSSRFRGSAGSSFGSVCFGSGYRLGFGSRGGSVRDGFWVWVTSRFGWVIRAQVRYGQIGDDLQPLSSGGYVGSSGSVESRFSFEYGSASVNKSERSEFFGLIFLCSGST
ncbi:hypothetical protein Hanom_Chr11g01018231 [Helianthus anomalus]